jgi:hypothetical protein
MSFLDLFKRNNHEQEKVGARTPLNLQVGDIIEYDLIEYEVIGKVTYQEGSYEWYDYHLAAGKDNLWLFAEDDDQLKLVMFEKLSLEEKIYSEFQSGSPTKINKDGKDFSLVEEGKAKIIVEGQVGAKTNQQVKYADYVAGDQWISVEWWGSELEISHGQEITESLIEYYPVQ